MKRRIVLAVALLCASAWAQNNQNNFSGGGNGVGVYTVANLPAAPANGTLAVVTNGSTGTDCTVGGGTTAVLCRYITGTGWGTFPAGSATAGGASTTIQYNNAGALGGIAQWATNGTTTIFPSATGVLNLGPALLSNIIFPTASATGFLRVTTATGALSSAEASGDCTTAGSAAFTCTKTSGTAFGAFATAPTGHNVALISSCSDSSGSGTAQSCTPSPAFTPATGDFLIYTTTTANTGTALTIAVNGGAAKSVAKWLGSTTLAAGDVPANKPVFLVYDGTNYELMTIGNAPAGSSGLSGMTAGQVPIAATATTVTSSKALQGSDTNILTSGTIAAGAGNAICTDGNSGATTTGCAGGTISGQVVGQFPLPGSSSSITNTVTAGTNQGQYVEGRTNTTQGTAATPSETQVGDCTSPGTITGAGTTYTVAYTDVIGCTIVHDIAGSAAATITIPTPTTLNNPHPIFVYENHSGSSDTLSPTTFTISLGHAAAASTLSVPSNVACRVNVDPVNASTWKADCHPIATSAAGGGAPGNHTYLAKTANYTTVSGDFSASAANATIVDYTISSSTTVTHTLPNTVTASGTFQFVKNDPTSTFGLYVAPANSLTLDGDTTSIFLEPGDEIRIESNGTNWISNLGAIRQSNSGGQLFPITPANAALATNYGFGGANVPYAVQFVLTQPQKIKNMSYAIQAGVAACTFDYAIYDVGLNMITHLGSTSCVTGNNFTTAVTTAITLAPGVYYAVGCSNTASGTLTFSNLSLSLAMTNLQEHVTTGIIGKAASGCAAGVLSSPLGAITNDSGNTGIPTFWVSP